MTARAITRPAGPLVRLAVQAETEKYQAALQRVVAAAILELDLPDSAQFNPSTMEWTYSVSATAPSADVGEATS
jgi:hypothetical protein